MALWKELLVLISGHRGPAAYIAFQRIGGWFRAVGFHFTISVCFAWISKGKLNAFVAIIWETMCIFLRDRSKLQFVYSIQ